MTSSRDQNQSNVMQMFVPSCVLMRTVTLTLMLLLVLSVSLGSWAQSLSGTLRIEVNDPTGALVPDAKVTVSNEATQVTSSLSRGDSGLYTFPSLNVGSYTVTVEKQGFTTFAKKNVTVAASVVAETKVTLQLGASTTTVEVSAAGADLVQTTTSTLSSGIEGSIAERIPVNTPGGDVKELAVFLPNTTTQPGGATGGSGGSVGGLRPRYNSFTIDGVDDNNIVTNGPLTPVNTTATGTMMLGPISKNRMRFRTGSTITVSARASVGRSGKTRSFSLAPLSDRITAWPPRQRRWSLPQQTV